MFFRLESVRLQSTTDCIHSSSQVGKREEGNYYFQNSIPGDFLNDVMSTFFFEKGPLVEFFNLKTALASFLRNVLSGC